MANPIEDDPKLAQAVGILAGRWGLVEVMVELIFTTLSGMPHRKSTIIFSFFRNVSTQRDVIKFMALETPSVGPDLTQEISDRLKEYVDMAGERNSVIHFPFGWDSDASPPTIYKMARQRRGDELYTKVPMTDETVMELANRVGALHDELIKLQIAVMDALAASLGKSLTPPPSQTPGLMSVPYLAPSPDEEPQPPPQSSQA